MSRFISPNPNTGFDLDSVEAWDFWKPDEKIAEQFGINKLTLEIHFKSGKTRRAYGETAQTLYDLLNTSALPLYTEKENKNG